MASAQSSQPQPGERSRKLLEFIFSQKGLEDEIRGHPQKVLDLIDDFDGRDYRLMTIGRSKGKIVTDLIDQLKPKTMVELGTYVGYSAILFGDAVRRNGGESFLSLEMNPNLAAVANMLIDLAGLRDFVRVIVGRSDLSLDRLHRNGELTKVELMFIDHHKPAYTTDLKLCEHLGMIVPGSVLVADNVLFPGNPPYLEYVRSTVEQKREAAKNGPTKNYDIEGIPERTTGLFMPKGDIPAFQVIGNPNLVYQSELRRPEGNRDAIEMTRCVGIQEA